VPAPACAPTRASRARALASTFAFALVSGALVVTSACGRGLSPRVDDPAASVASPRVTEVPANAAAARAVAPAAAPGPGYALMDLAAIKRAVHGGGRPVLVHFWASWCGPCLEELPLVDKFARDMKARGVEVLSLSLDDAERAGAHVVEVLTNRAPNLTRNIVRVADTEGFINTIDPRWEGSIPALFAYDEKGQLRDRLIGEASRRDLDNLVSRISSSGRK
jgi:thiol-disulfide isomerase/thioredoxin